LYKGVTVMKTPRWISGNTNTDPKKASLQIVWWRIRRNGSWSYAATFLSPHFGNKILTRGNTRRRDRTRAHIVKKFNNEKRRLGI
jgi:hypothetical protein